MKKVLLLALCLLVALPAMANANILKACGQAFVFGVFPAPGGPGVTVCWKECSCTVLIGAETGQILGDRCVTTDSCGKFCFNLQCVSQVIRENTCIAFDGTYLSGMFHVCGTIDSINFKCGPDQDTTLTTAYRIDAF